MYFCGSQFSFISCFFESVAGFSTTGCSVLDIDIVPMSMLLWSQCAIGWEVWVSSYCSFLSSLCGV